MDKVDELIIDVALGRNGRKDYYAGRNIQAELDAIAKGEEKVVKANKRLANSNKAVTSSGIALGKAFRFLAGFFVAKDILNSITAMDSLNASFESLAGSASAGRDEIRFLREESNRLGLDFETIAKSYKGLFAAGQGAGLGVDFIRSLFGNVMQAGVALQSNKQSLAGALLAIEQMISKGKISMQELRQQLSNALPGAMQIASKGMGVTTKELEKMLSKGLDSVTFLKAFNKELAKQYGDKWQKGAKSLNAELNRLNNAFFDLKVSLAEGGVISALTTGVQALTSALKVLSESIKHVAFASASLFIVKFSKSYRVLARYRLLIWKLKEVFTLFLLNIKDGIGLLKSLTLALSTSSLSKFTKASWALVAPWAKLLIVFELIDQAIKIFKGEWNWLAEFIDKIERGTWWLANKVTGQNKAFQGTFSSDVKPVQPVSMPSSNVSNTNANINQNVTFNINEASNPQQVAAEVDRVLTNRLTQAVL